MLHPLSLFIVDVDQFGFEKIGKARKQHHDPFGFEIIDNARKQRVYCCIVDELVIKFKGSKGEADHIIKVRHL